MSELIIMVAPNGSRRDKRDHPKLPITPLELAQTASACQAAGASAIHLHVRDEVGRHSLSPVAYRAAIMAIEAKCAAGIVTQVTTESAGQFDFPEQVALVEALLPAAISFSLAEMLRHGEAPAIDFMRWARQVGTAIQFILYSAGEVRRFASLWRTPGTPILECPVIILVVGRYAETQESSVEEFDQLYAALVETGLAEASVWMTCAFGRGELACVERSIARGGHARVGFENAVVDASGRPARDNAERVALVADLAAHYSRPLADANRCAQLLSMRRVGALLA